MSEHDDLLPLVKAVGLLMESHALLARDVYEASGSLSDQEKHDRIVQIEQAREVLELAMQLIDAPPSPEGTPH